MASIKPNLRQKIYLILVFISLGLLFYSIWQVYPIVVEVEDPLGLASNLTPCYWIGLALLVATSILAFFDHELKKDGVFIFIAVVLGLFLVGITVFGYKNAPNLDSYLIIGQTPRLLAEHHLDIANPPSLLYYSSWPAGHFTSASILEITDISGSFLLKYWPLFWIVTFVFITYAIGKRLGLESNRCFLVSFLALSSWTVLYQYAPNSVGIILYLLLFMLLLTLRRTVAESVMAVLIFATLIITHGFTALAVFPALIALAIYRKEPRFIALFIAMFGAWYIYQASAAMEAGIPEFLTYPFKQIFWATDIERYQVASPMVRAVARYSTLSRPALYGIFMVGSIILLLRRKITGQRRKQVISIFCWLIGTSLVIFLGYGGELARGYVFSVVAAACVIALSFSSRKLLVPLMCLLVVLFPLANYAAITSWGQVLTTQLEGSKFLALEVSPQSRYFSDFEGTIMIARYYNPAQMEVSAMCPEYLVKLPSEVRLSLLDEQRYVVISKQGSDRQMISWGEDPYAAWTQTEAGQRADLIYNNGYFQIYQNHLAE